MPAERKGIPLTTATALLLVLAAASALLWKSAPPAPAIPAATSAAHGDDSATSNPPGPQEKPGSPSRDDRQLLAKYGAPMNSLDDLMPRWRELERSALPDATRRRIKSLLVRTASQVAPDYMALLSSVCDLAGPDEGMALIGELRDPEDVYSATGGIRPAGDYDNDRQPPAAEKGNTSAYLRHSP